MAASAIDRDEQLRNRTIAYLLERADDLLPSADHNSPLEPFSDGSFFSDGTGFAPVKRG